MATEDKTITALRSAEAFLAESEDEEHAYMPDHDGTVCVLCEVREALRAHDEPMEGDCPNATLEEDVRLSESLDGGTWTEIDPTWTLAEAIDSWQGQEHTLRVKDIGGTEYEIHGNGTCNIVG